MRWRACKVLAALVLLAAAAGALYAALAGGARGHLADADCAGCHLAGRDAGAGNAGLLTASQEALCAKCHPASAQMSHPSGLRPAHIPPAPYPLDWKGDLTCSTCHEVHGAGRGLVRGSRGGKELCLACHAAEFFARMRDGGASLLAGHLGGRMAPGVAPGAPGLDQWSRKCMDCHGEGAAPGLATSVDSRGVVRHASQSASHPVGVSYQKAVAFGGYRPQRSVERKLLLPGGKVGCVSCHGGYQKEHGKLLVAMAGSALCMECHDL